MRFYVGPLLWLSIDVMSVGGLAYVVSGRATTRWSARRRDGMRAYLDSRLPTPDSRLSAIGLPVAVGFCVYGAVGFVVAGAATWWLWLLASRDTAGRGAAAASCGHHAPARRPTSCPEPAHAVLGASRTRRRRERSVRRGRRLTKDAPAARAAQCRYAEVLMASVRARNAANGGSLTAEQILAYRDADRR